MFTMTSTTSSGATPVLSLDHRNGPLRFEDGSRGEVAYPINYTELYNLKGRLLTLIDATFTDPQQRKAHKDVVWQTLKAWMDDIEGRRLDWPRDSTE
jgi:hypothetical protein